MSLNPGYGRLKGKVAIVTGAAGGIGRAIAIAFAREGARVIISTNRNLDGLHETRRLGGEDAIIAVQADAASAADNQRLVELAEGEFGRLDILCANAAIVTDAMIVDMTEEDWDRVIDVNLKGPFLAAKYAIPAMQKVGGGSIINIGSINSFIGEPLHAHYCASKGGVMMLTKSIALEHAKDKIRCNAICPGWIDTPMNAEYMEGLGGRESVEEMLVTAQPLGMGQPDQIASVAVFLASNESSLITGTDILADGGFTAQ